MFLENEEYGVLTDQIALQGILEAVLQMANLMQQEIPLLLNSIDFDNVEDFAANMARNANSLRILRVFTNNAVSLVELVENHVSNIPSSTNKFTGKCRGN